MHQHQRPIELRCFPHEDAEFRVAVERMLEHAREMPRQGTTLHAEVQRRLRETYPRVRIQPRDPLADEDEAPAEIWYCFREGGLLG